MINLIYWLIVGKPMCLHQYEIVQDKKVDVYYEANQGSLKDLPGSFERHIIQRCPHCGKIKKDHIRF